MQTLHALIWAFVLSLSPSSAIAQAEKPAAPSTEGAQLTAIITEYTEAAKHLDPYWSHYYNVEADLGKFGDYLSPEYFERAKNAYKTALSKLRKLNRSRLSAGDERTYRLFEEDMRVSLKQLDFPDELLEFNQMSNRLMRYQDDSSQALTFFPFDSVKHYDDFVKRSEGFGPYIDRQIETFRRGIKKGITLSCDVAPLVPNTYKDSLETDVEKHPFYRPVGFMPKEFSKMERERLTAAYKKMVSERIIPGYQKFNTFYLNEYAPKCRKEYGTHKLPRAREWYASKIEARTNLRKSPEEIHQIGLKEVARIDSELRAVQRELGFAGSQKDFLKSLSSDEKFFFTSRDEMFEAFEEAKARVAAQIPKYFNLIPKTEYKLVEASNPEDAAAKYSQPTENLPYGRFVVNTKNLRSTPKFGVTTLSMHEAVPGHHFQLALVFEQKDSLSEYQRKVFDSTSYVEGWALYAEFLGREMGMYTDPMQKLGNLQDEMLRAVRLVVDTGIHHKGWDRKKTIEYMSKYLASDAGDISNEANRYSVWPAQALAYKLGQLKIIELRRMAEKALGGRFDIREFHRVVIGNGTVSLGVLESQVKDWIASSNQKPKS